jgi:hypothetical protein
VPKVWNDVAQVIHYYEALLATLAILVWHFYWVDLRSERVPDESAWLIGKKAPHQSNDSHEAESMTRGRGTESQPADPPPSGPGFTGEQA